VSGGVSSNYTFTYVDGTLSVTAAALNVKADNKAIYKGESIPKFTATYTGFKNGDQSTITYGPVFSLSPCSGGVGVYTITPSGLKFKNSANYTITYTPGTLYINPKGSPAHKITVKLDCINQLTNDPSGFGYVAHFSYINPNATAVYVPRGADNSLTAQGSYQGSPAEVFLPAGGKFDVYFDGAKLTWTLKTYEGSQKITVTAEASSTSAKCTTGARIASPESTLTAATLEGQEIVALPKIGVYPNPVLNRLSVYLSTKQAVEDRDILIYDMAGRLVRAKKVSHTAANIFIVDMSNLTSGVYLVKIKTDKGYSTAKIVKQ